MQIQADLDPYKWLRYILSRSVSPGQSFRIRIFCHWISCPYFRDPDILLLPNAIRMSCYLISKSGSRCHLILKKRIQVFHPIQVQISFTRGHYTPISESSEAAGFLSGFFNNISWYNPCLSLSEWKHFKPRGEAGAEGISKAQSRSRRKKDRFLPHFVAIQMYCTLLKHKKCLLSSL